MILGCTLALQCNPTWCLLKIDIANAHSDCSRGKMWEEKERDSYLHFLIQIFLNLYGESCTPQWHFGNGPDQPPTSLHGSGDGLRQGETMANVIFNILAARLYMAFMKIIGDRGVFFAIADDVKIARPPSNLAEIVAQLLGLAMSEAGLKI